MKNQLLSVFLITATATTSLFGMEPEKWNGPQYAQNSEIQFGAGMRLLGQIKLEEGDPEAVILDLCCGYAKLAAHIATNVLPQGTVTAIDFSQSMIDKANEQYGHIPNLK